MKIDYNIRTKINKIATININIFINIYNKHEGSAEKTITKHKTARTMNINVNMNTNNEKEAKTAVAKIRETLTKAGIQYTNNIYELNLNSTSIYSTIQ